MTRWTEEQERAIALSDRRLLISAAAGSGKTAVLTERIVARVIDPKHPVDIDELLIMTFTRAAAAEMRERIRRRLEDCLQQALRDGEAGIAARAKRELAELDAARITTIDSFCLTVLREHADRLAVDPAFRVGSEEELRILQNDVLEELLEEQYEKAAPAFLRFADAFSQGKADLGIGEEILSLYRFAESLPWPEEWLLRVEAEAERTDGNVSESAYQRYMAEELRKLGAELCGFAEEAQLLCEEGGLNGYEGAVQSDLGKLQRLRAAEDYPSACLALTAFQTYDRLGRNKKDSDPDCASRVKSLREFWKKALKKPLEAFGRGDAEAADGVEDAETVRTLIGLARDFSARFLAKKREKNLLDFSDLEHETLALFWESDAAGKRHPSEIAREYQAAFREIYVDEYQDSNGVQEELLRAIETGRL
ncbi:UvrD-helicase domain-containing protein, partial [Stomatobaculum longum]|uniref:UvrD-helicase domain-containing protein n=1 Tax=Stomatobaculum longum TaxID=796942 RepID=UPI002880677D